MFDKEKRSRKFADAVLGAAVGQDGSAKQFPSRAQEFCKWSAPHSHFAGRKTGLPNRQPHHLSQSYALTGFLRGSCALLFDGDVSEGRETDNNIDVIT